MFVGGLGVGNGGIGIRGGRAEPAAADAAFASAPAVAYLSDGCFAIPFAITSSKLACGCAITRLS